MIDRMAPKSDTTIAADLEKLLGKVMRAMPPAEKGKLVYFAMKTVMSRQARMVRNQVLSSGLKVTRDQIKDAVYGWANAWTASGGVKVRPSKIKKWKKGRVPVKREGKEDYRLPILMWARDGTKPHTNIKDSSEGRYIGCIEKGKYEFIRNKSAMENQANAMLPKEVDRRLKKWIEKNFNNR